MASVLGVFGEKRVFMEFRVERKKRGRQSPQHPGFGVSVRPRKHKMPAKAEVYWMERTPVDFYSFDEEYLRRLGACDPATEAHFVAYFNERLRITLRARGVDANTIEDVRQETFYRVLVALKAGNVQNPQGFGSYVHSVAKHVLSEKRRIEYRNQHDPLETTDVADEKISMEELLQRREHNLLVRTILAEMPERDRHLLQARFFDDRDNQEVCDDFGVDRDYLRVLFHRAINRFGELYKKRNN